MFCNQCGTQVPDGTPVCPKCGAATGSAPVAQAAPCAKKCNILEKLFGVSEFLNWPALIAWASALLFTFIPWFKSSNFSGSRRAWRNMYVVGDAYTDHDFVLFAVLGMVALLVLILQKKNFLASVVSSGFALFVMVEVIVKAARCTKYDGKMNAGMFLFLVAVLAICALCWLSGVFAKAFANGAQRKAMVKQQQAAYNQQMMQQMQYQQAPQFQQAPQQFQQAPQFQQPQQFQQAPQQPQQPQQ